MAGRHRVREPAGHARARRDRRGPARPASSVSSVCRSIGDAVLGGDVEVDLRRRPRRRVEVRATADDVGAHRQGVAEQAALGVAGAADHRPARTGRRSRRRSRRRPGGAPRRAPRCCAARGRASCRRGCARRGSRCGPSAAPPARPARWCRPPSATGAPRPSPRSPRAGRRCRSSGAPTGTPCRGGRGARPPRVSRTCPVRSTTSSPARGDVGTDGVDRRAVEAHVASPSRRRASRAAGPVRFAGARRWLARRSHRPKLDEKFRRRGLRRSV